MNCKMSSLTLTASLIAIICIQLGSAYRIRTTQMPKACTGKKFCSKTSPNYPTELLNKLLKDSWVVSNTDIHSNTTNRCGEDGGLCKSKPSAGLIYYIEDPNGNVRTVVQTENFKQDISVTECRNKGVLGLDGNDDFRVDTFMSYTATCREVTLNFNFLVLSLDEKSLETAQVNGGLPVCCVCDLQTK